MIKVKPFIPFLLGAIAGAIGGYAYYHFVGCNGSCMIASSPIISTLYGALMGILTVNLFYGRKEKKELS